MARFLLISSSYPMGDDDAEPVGLCIQDFARHLVALGHDVTVLTPSRGDARPKAEARIDVVRFACLRPRDRYTSLRWFDPRDLLVAISVIVGGLVGVETVTRRQSFDAAIACWAVPSGLWALYGRLRRGLPYAVWCLGSDIWIYGRKAGAKSLVSLILRRASRMYADGLALADEVTRLAGSPCTFLATSRTLPSTATGTRAPSERVRFLFVGRYHPSKGPDLLLEAVAALPLAVRRRATFVLHGFGEELTRLAELRSRLGLSEVEIKGRLGAAEVASAMRGADYLVIPSRLDSIPVVFSEALQASLPMVATDVGDTGRLIRQYGLGFVAAPESPASLADALAKAIDVEPSSFLSNCQTALTLFDGRATAGRLAQDLAG